MFGKSRLVITAASLFAFAAALAAHSYPVAINSSPEFESPLPAPAAIGYAAAHRLPSGPGAGIATKKSKRPLHYPLAAPGAQVAAYYPQVLEPAYLPAQTAHTLSHQDVFRIRPPPAV